MTFKAGSIVHSRCPSKIRGIIMLWWENKSSVWWTDRSVSLIDERALHSNACSLQERESEAKGRERPHRLTAQHHPQMYIIIQAVVLPVGQQMRPDALELDLSGSVWRMIYKIKYDY
ncbi:hypothetical protein IRJ41_003910 [Triplophysa rosa]|uniref:Uncharacterized protein n=1 Tax=Triplophysa rosa TaxID=992332 RepID=A0A9W7WUE5_TRIRA|nr:hypothetical protein IRJ41_003910 [Triplophysa rosa]